MIDRFIGFRTNLNAPDWTQWPDNAVREFRHGRGAVAYIVMFAASNIFNQMEVSPGASCTNPPTDWQLRPWPHPDKSFYFHVRVGVHDLGMLLAIHVGHRNDRSFLTLPLDWYP